jgi:hypothetical protein
MMGDAIDSLRSVLDTMPDAPSRERARSALQQISKTVGPAAPPRGLPPPGQVSAATAAAPVDANSLYSESVKAKLVAAMLDHSLQMNLGDEEWLTVAARASDGPMPGSGLAESITIILRVKGSDLGIYHTDKNRREEILEKVKREARVF